MILNISFLFNFFAFLMTVCREKLLTLYWLKLTIEELIRLNYDEKERDQIQFGLPRHVAIFR